MNESPKAGSMNIVLINWSGGENNPFSNMNQCYAEKLKDCGCTTKIIDTNDNFFTNFLTFQNQTGKIDLALTHQGIGTNWEMSSGQNLWEYFGIKLLSLCSDHPVHCPANHSADSKFIIHSYCLQSYTNFANRNPQRNFPAVFLEHPPLLYESKKTERVDRSGDYFVFPKNIDSLDEIFEDWKKEFPQFVSDLLVNISEEIKHNFLAGDPLDHLNVIDNGLSNLKNIELHSKKEARLREQFFRKNSTDAIRCFLHEKLDKVYRNCVSEFVASEMRDFPMHINGRGWDRIERTASKKHTFNDVSKLKDLDFQFFSNYGVLDVVPVKDAGHDRIGRAMRYGTSFLSNCRVPWEASLGAPFHELFYTGEVNDLKSKAEFVMRHPERHREMVLEYKEARRKNMGSFESFYNYIYSLAMSDELEETV